MSDGAPLETMESPETQLESLEALFSALESPLLAYAYTLVKNSSTAQDLVQEAFVRLHNHFETVQQPKPWLYRTVHNLAANHHRAQRKIVPLKSMSSDGDPGSEQDRDIPDDWPSPDQALQRLEAIDCARQEIEAMAPRPRELVGLRFREGLSYKEISERTGLSVSNVGYILHHALKGLAADLRTRGIGP